MPRPAVGATDDPRRLDGYADKSGNQVDHVAGSNEGLDRIRHLVPAPAALHRRHPPKQIAAAAKAVIPGYTYG